jgi:hypothetical protein
VIETEIVEAGENTTTAIIVGARDEDLLVVSAAHLSPTRMKQTVGKLRPIASDHTGKSAAYLRSARSATIGTATETARGRRTETVTAIGIGIESAAPGL